MDALKNATVVSIQYNTIKLFMNKLYKKSMAITSIIFTSAFMNYL